MDEERQKGEKAQDKSQATFKVTDRRLFTADGELRADIPDEPEARPGTPPPPDERPSTETVSFDRRPVTEPEGIDFTVLINAMTQPALIFLGEVPHPGTGQSVVDIEQARLQIDLLDLLRVKTRGNLTPQEESLLERVLYQLRMIYVARTGAGAKT